jgi:hypothetical protein
MMLPLEASLRWEAIIENDCPPDDSANFWDDYQVDVWHMRLKDGMKFTLMSFTDPDDAEWIFGEYEFLTAEEAVQWLMAQRH